MAIDKGERFDDAPYYLLTRAAQQVFHDRA